MKTWKIFQRRRQEKGETTIHGPVAQLTTKTWKVLKHQLTIYRRNLNLRYWTGRISWGWELKGSGSGTYLQLPANRLPVKFKPNQKYYLAFGSVIYFDRIKICKISQINFIWSQPDLKYPGCPGTVQCRFLEHCENSRRFFDSFTTFAANACPIGDQ